MVLLLILWVTSCNENTLAKKHVCHAYVPEKKVISVEIMSNCPLERNVSD